MAVGELFGDGADLLAEMLGGTSFGGVWRDALGPAFWLDFFPIYRDSIHAHIATH